MSLIEFAELFEILSEVFLDPEADVKLRMSSLAGRFTPDEPDLAALRPDLEALAGLGEDPRQLAVEYVRLFMHGTTNQTVHPYESVQSRGRLMDQECLQDLRQLFDRADVRPRDDVAMPPDHLGLELEFMAFVLGNLARSSGDGHSREHWQAIAEGMLNGHLMPFVRNFSARLEKAGPEPYYRLACRLMVSGLGALDARLAAKAADVPSV